MHVAAAPMQPQVADVYYEGGVDPDITAFQQHQKTAPRPEAAEEARTWAALASSTRRVLPGLMQQWRCAPGLLLQVSSRATISLSAFFVHGQKQSFQYPP
eukprot:scaffold177954_cov15-Tisochrysis_lutea.AAC.1